MMHQAAYRYCRPVPSIAFDTYTCEGRTIVVCSVPASAKRPVYAQDEDGQMRAYVRIGDENIVASPVLLTLWQESQKARGAVITYDDTVRRLLNVMQGSKTLNQIVRQSRLPRRRVVMLLSRLIRFGTAKWEYKGQQFLFSLT